MLNAQNDHPIHPSEIICIDVLARDLQLSVATILQCAAERMLYLFFPTYPHDYTCISVHKKRIDADQDASSSKAKVKKTRTKAKTKSGTDLNAPVKAISMCVNEIEGLILSEEDCQQLLHHHRISQRLFPAALWKYMGSHEAILPIRERGIDTASSDADEWKIACYDKAKTSDSSIDGAFPALINFDISIKSSQLFATGESVHRFMEIIYSPRCVFPLILLDKDSGIGDVITDRPVYFSEKLNYLIDTSERFWRRKEPIKPCEYEERRQKVFAALGSKDFASLFAKNELADGTHAAAAKFIEPIFAREKDPNDLKKEWTGYLSPELFKLMAAAKLFWSTPDVVLDEVLTHPKKESIESYFRAVGISGNDTSAAVTLIRPEGAARGGNGTPRSKVGTERFF
jgi:hypothetical protein